ncbi:MAG: hypothetical protein E2598_12965 [Sphingobium sp.]|nr:hypothetical protein [Sphingobium sp.]
MKSLSISAAWQESSLFLRREISLLLPVALLFIGVPMAALFQAIPPSLRQITPGQGVPEVDMSFAAILVLFLAPLAMIGGMLTLYALALKPGVSVQEAMRHAVRRVPVALGATLLLGAVLMAPMAFAMAGPAGSLVFLVAVILLSARLMALNAVVTDQPVGPIAALRESWLLARGHTLRLVAFMLLLSVPVMVAQIVAQALMGLIGFAIGGQEAAQQFGDFGTAMATAVGQLIMVVMTSRLYRQMLALRLKK